MDSPEQCHEPIANRDRGAGREVVVVQGWRQNLTGDTELNGPRPASWWTGRVPAVGSCPGVAADGTLRSLPLLDLSACSRAEVLDYFHNGWALTETLFSALQGEEAFYRPPFHRLRHAMIFYYAHPAALYVNKLRLAGLVAGPVDAHFEQLFETGVDEMAWDDLSKNELKWPSVREVTEYRRTVYGIVRRLIETHPCFEALPIDQQSPAWALMLGMEHERIHLELSSVLVRELPLRLVRRPEVWAPYHASAGSLSSEAPTPSLDFPRNEMISIPSGSVVLGKPRAVPSYSWDNAYGERAFAVRAFDVSKFPISHGEWLAFIVAGGYQTPRYWSEAGWAWRTSRNAKAPAFWVPDGPAGSNLYRFRLLFDVVDMPWSWPVSVNYFEAKAYCAWLTEREGGDQAYRLISEPEHHRIRPRGAATDAANLELSFGSESPVDAFPPGFEGVHDVRGNVWTWCEDHFAALPGFAPDPLYDDFSTPCFDGKHQLILGGSFVSTGDEASVWARFHFRPHFHQHAGFRLVRSAHALQKSCADAPPPHVGGKPCCTNLPAVASPYDTNELLFQYLTLHFATAAETAPGPMIHPDVVNFPRRRRSRLQPLATASRRHERWTLGALSEARASSLGACFAKSSASTSRSRSCRPRARFRRTADFHTPCAWRETSFCPWKPSSTRRSIVAGSAFVKPTHAPCLQTLGASTRCSPATSSVACRAPARCSGVSVAHAVSSSQAGSCSIFHPGRGWRTSPRSRPGSAGRSSMALPDGRVTVSPRRYVESSSCSRRTTSRSSFANTRGNSNTSPRKRRYGVDVGRRDAYAHTPHGP